jgi:hypothetical protein
MGGGTVNMVVAGTATVKEGTISTRKGTVNIAGVGGIVQEPAIAFIICDRKNTPPSHTAPPPHFFLLRLYPLSHASHTTIPPLP